MLNLLRCARGGRACCVHRSVRLSVCPSRSSGALQELASLTRFNSCTWDTSQPCTQKSCSCANCVNPSITYRSKSSGELSASGEALTSKEVGLGGMRDTSAGKECAKSSQVLSGWELCPCRMTASVLKMWGLVMANSNRSSAAQFQRAASLSKSLSSGLASVMAFCVV